MVLKKSQDARTQLHVWSKLLDGRMALQKVMLAVRELEAEKTQLDVEHDNEKVEDQQEKTNSMSTNEATIKSISKLLSSLVILRDTYRNKSQFCADSSRISHRDSDAEQYPQIDDEILEQQHTSHTEVRNSIIEKWCEKTKIGTIPKKGYAALELPTLQLITNALKDKNRLIRRTQLDRSINAKDDSIHPETFNDDDFYHQLLKEVISKDEDRKWVELQRLKYKSKRKADTKATKGRKIKKDLIPKLVNFMAPYRPMNSGERQTIPPQIRNELIKSLFGGSVL